MPSHGAQRLDDVRRIGGNFSVVCSSLPNSNSSSVGDGAQKGSSQPQDTSDVSTVGPTDKSSVESSWAEMLLAMPLELAAASAKTNDHWLQKRKRKHWWKREQFPRVCTRTPPEFASLFSALALIPCSWPRTTFC